MTLINAILLSLFIIFPVYAASFEDIYQLGPGDKIQIQVYGEEELSVDQLLLSSSGTFDYPYLGQISAKGKTPEQLKNEIYHGLKGDYLVSPKVRINIISYRQIYVNGEVKRPGGYEYKPGLTVDKAIALAGGFTDRASRNAININPANNGPQRKKVSLKHNVEPGDIIVIDQSFF
ncbi:polysaccharide biosynthesis/export family protein [Photobacterium atrarenae]|uniref:Polysaccharide export protein n=1 Tax=Photobacterium atrarenae TaxID=865757 RepID=A0ABY5GMC5_9GAMM|nr:polysaccharide biosynthesis/export family protein [Photobacterium atrarenae]UTV30455.1 polysaccharide export protein [Photobacterium atrarenae]